MTRLIDDRMSKLQQQKNDETHDMSFREKILQYSNELRNSLKINLMMALKRERKESYINKITNNRDMSLNLILRKP